jgi:hypothetical protein
MTREAGNSTIPRLDRGISLSGIAIAIESPLQDDIRVLITELNAVLHALTPPEFGYPM